MLSNLPTAAKAEGNVNAAAGEAKWLVNPTSWESNFQQAHTQLGTVSDESLKYNSKFLQTFSQEKQQFD